MSRSCPGGYGGFCFGRKKAKRNYEECVQDSLSLGAKRGALRYEALEERQLL